MSVLSPLKASPPTTDTEQAVSSKQKVDRGFFFLRVKDNSEEGTHIRTNGKQQKCFNCCLHGCLHILAFDLKL